ncbi:TPA: hypothetical protein N0F65_002992 [Lagenidium giganteum]|uniref:Plasma membrane proteolipid 3 n=1 Tax=Lagenidium giganteum TaxID=4803 RepID=A0AAV2YR47_9STRA|nr:TPA: hypothetical protein N0F65_002992 [Lagenidium giganteum]
MKSSDRDRYHGWWEEGLSPSDGHRSSSSSSGSGHSHAWHKIARIICGIVFPPLGVFLQVGCAKDLAINVLLTLFGYLPGILHALFIILTA